MYLNAVSLHLLTISQEPSRFGSWPECVWETNNG